MTGLVLNPTLRLRLAADVCAALWCTRRAGPRRRDLSRRAGAALLAIARGRAPAELLDVDALAWLVDAELLIAAPPPTPRWAPPLLTAASPGPTASTASTASVGPTSPVALDPDHHLVFETGDAELEQRAPWGGAWTRWRLSAGAAAAFADAVAGAPVDPAEAAPLIACGALAGPSATAQRRARLWQWHAAAQRAHAGAGVAVLPDWPPPAELAALQTYALAVLERGYLDGDFGVAGKLRSHVFDDPALRPLHARAAALARAVTGRPLAPSYSFLAFYHRGGGLPAHRDKSHCMVSMSVALLASPDWPLQLTDRDGARSVGYLATGQTLLFDGRRYAHARPPLTDPLAIYLVLHFQTDPETIA